MQSWLRIHGLADFDQLSREGWFETEISQLQRLLALKIKGRRVSNHCNIVTTDGNPSVVCDVHGQDLILEYLKMTNQSLGPPPFVSYPKHMLRRPERASKYLLHNKVQPQEVAEVMQRMNYGMDWCYWSAMRQA